MKNSRLLGKETTSNGQVADASGIIHAKYGSNLTKQLLVLCAMLLAFAGANQSFAAAVYWGPGAAMDINTNYVSTADIPAGFYAGGSPTCLDTLEDNSLDCGISADNGAVFFYTGDPLLDNVDSVDNDDGAIDGDGLDGHSWLYNNRSGTDVIPSAVTFTFTSTVTAAGLVWTDGEGEVTFEAFGPGMVSLGVVTYTGLPDTGCTVTFVGDGPGGTGCYEGQTAEDRFLGATDLGGILAIKVSGEIGGLEVDHIQYGSAVVPVPAAVWLFGSGLLGLVGIARRKKA